MIKEENEFIFQELGTTVSKQITGLLKATIIIKGLENNENLYKKIVKVTDKENFVDHYYLNYPEDKIKLFSISITYINPWSFVPLEHPRMVIDFNS